MTFLTGDGSQVSRAETAVTEVCSERHHQIWLQKGDLEA